MQETYTPVPRTTRSKEKRDTLVGLYVGDLTGRETNQALEDP